MTPDNDPALQPVRDVIDAAQASAADPDTDMARVARAARMLLDAVQEVLYLTGEAQVSGPDTGVGARRPVAWTLDPARVRAVIQARITTGTWPAGEETGNAR